MAHSSSHFDPQLGIDLHFYLTPPATPIPTPHIGLVFDPMEYVPILGSNVHINGRKRATAGTGGYCVHIPVAGVFTPPLSIVMGPQKDDDIFMGSRTVSAGGEPFSRIGVPTLSCNFIGLFPPPRAKKPEAPGGSPVMPLTINMAIPNAVNVGGPLTVNLMALAMRTAFWGFSHFKQSSLYSKAMDKFKSLRQKLFGGMPEGFLKCKILRAEPVDIRDGSVVVEHLDFSLPGRFPLTWARYYRSSNDDNGGICGHRWKTLADAELLCLHAEDIGWLNLPDGLYAIAELPKQPGEAYARPLFPAGGRIWCEEKTRGEQYWIVEEDGGTRYHFAIPVSSHKQDTPQPLPISAVGDRHGNCWSFVRHQGTLTRLCELTHLGPTGREILCTLEDQRIVAMTLYDTHQERQYPLTRYQYNGGCLSAEIDAQGNARSYRYDQGYMTSHSDRLGLTFYYEYDERWRVIHAWGDNGLYDYRFTWCDLLDEVEIVDSLGYHSVVKFNTLGLPICETDHEGGTTTFVYDDNGMTRQVILPSGRRYQWEYDEFGRITAEISPSGQRYSFSYSLQGWLLQSTDATGSTWTQTFDEAGNLVTQCDPTGVQKSFTYDAFGQPIQLQTAGNKIHHVVYDAYGFIREYRMAGMATNRLENNIYGNPVHVVEDGGRQIRYVWDNKQRLVEQQSNDGSPLLRITYDKNDRPVIYQEDGGRKTRLGYSGTGTIATCQTPDGHQLHYHYDTEEQLIGVSNQLGQRWQLKRNYLGRLAEETDYWGQTTSYHYDADGNLLRRIDPLGQILRYQYDPDANLTAKLPADGDTPLVTYRYDECGRLVQCNNRHRQLSWEYDAAGRVLLEQQDHYRLLHRYNLAGQYIRRESNAGHSVDYQYNAFGQIVSVALNDAMPIQLQYDEQGRLVRQQLSETLLREFDYDPAQRLTSQRVLQQEQSLFATRYHYDQHGNLTDRYDSLDGHSRFTYDPIGRLLSVMEPDSDIRRFVTDAAGNCMTSTVQAVDDTPTGWYREGRFAQSRYIYDRAGNLRQRRVLTQPDSKQDLVWDTEHQLVEVRQNGQRVSFGYDGLGRRVFKQSAQGVHVFFWQGHALSGEMRSEAELPESESVYDLATPILRKLLLEPLLTEVREYVYHPGSFQPFALLEQRQGEKTNYLYDCDPNGAPIRLIDTEGKLVWHHRMEAWGKPGPQLVNQVENPLRFQGQYYDSETGLHYNRYRYYDPESGTYISQDPIGLAGGLNLYQYGPNPLSWIDPLGLTACSEISKIHDEIQERTTRVSAAVDRWLGSSNSRLAQAYRDYSVSNPNFASLIKGRIVDRRMNSWMKGKYGDIPGATFDLTIPGSGRLRPDAYFPNLDGKSVIFDIGGTSKATDILKYEGMADIIIPIYH